MICAAPVHLVRNHHKNKYLNKAPVLLLRRGRVFVSRMELKVKSAKLFHVFVKLKLSSGPPKRASVRHTSVSRAAAAADTLLCRDVSRLHISSTSSSTTATGWTLPDHFHDRLTAWSVPGPYKNRNKMYKRQLHNGNREIIALNSVI